MQDRIADYDLSFLKNHEVSSISFTLTDFALHSNGPPDRTTHTKPDSASIEIACGFELNGEKVERGALLALLGQTFGDCWIDTDFDLHLRFTSGDELVAIRDETGFECYLIQWSLDPNKYVAII